MMAAKAPAQNAPAQLVTTVTKIINVIPAGVQIALGALVALALALGISSRLASLRGRSPGPGERRVQVVHRQGQAPLQIFHRQRAMTIAV